MLGDGQRTEGSGAGEEKEGETHRQQLFSGW